MEQRRKDLDRACPYPHQIDPSKAHWTVMANDHDNCLESCSACEWMREQERRGKE
jgi:hypothetical protein